MRIGSGVDNIDVKVRHLNIWKIYGPLVYRKYHKPLFFIKITSLTHNDLHNSTWLDQAAGEMGIAVCNVPGYGVEEVAHNF